MDNLEMISECMLCLMDIRTDVRNKKKRTTDMGAGSAAIAQQRAEGLLAGPGVKPWAKQRWQLVKREMLQSKAAK